MDTSLNEKVKNSIQFLRDRKDDVFVANFYDVLVKKDLQLMHAVKDDDSKLLISFLLVSDIQSFTGLLRKNSEILL